MTIPLKQQDTVSAFTRQEEFMPESSKNKIAPVLPAGAILFFALIFV